MPCFLCGRTDGPVRFEESPYVARACVDCGVIFTDPPPPLEDTLSRLRDQHDESFYAAPAQYRARWLAERIPAGRLLEVGCGSGAQLAAFAAEGFVVEGIEAVPERASGAQVPVRIGFFEDQPPEPVFDCVYHTDLLSHFAEPAKTLRRMKAWLKPGGFVAFEVGAQAENPAQWNDNPGLHVHRWFFTQTGIRSLLSAAGLQVVHQTHFDLTMYVAWLRGVRAIRRVGKRATRAPNASTGPQPARTLSHRIASVLRYPIGRRWPGKATGTVLVIAQGG